MSIKGKRVMYIAKIFDLLGISNLLFKLTNLFIKPHIRIINYHKTPLNFEKNFENQINYLLNRYQPIAKKELLDFLKTGYYPYKKNGIIFTFDDGFKSNFEILSLLERYGITGFFFVSPNLVGSEEKESHLFEREKYMNWDELKKLSEKHVIGSHTLNHTRMYLTLKENEIYKEIKESREILEKKLKKTIDIFCWVGGEESTYSPLAEEIIRKNYEYIFRTNCLLISKHTNKFLLERTNIEVNWPNYLINFYLSGVVDILYIFKRRRLAKAYDSYK